MRQVRLGRLAFRESKEIRVSLVRLACRVCQALPGRLALRAALVRRAVQARPARLALKVLSVAAVRLARPAALGRLV